MLVLIVDTTDFNTAHLGLWQNGRLLVKTSFKAQKKLSDKLLPAIIKLSKKAGVPLDRLDLVEVAKSETGSFTGQRVGMAVGKALGFGLNIVVRNSKLKSQNSNPNLKT